MYQVEDDVFKVCPYDRAHVVSKPRYQLHVIKCKEKHPGEKLSTCFYNYSHKIKREHLLEHYEICPNKAFADEDRHFELMTYLTDADEPARSTETQGLRRDEGRTTARERETGVRVHSCTPFLKSSEIDELGYVVDD